MVLDDIKTLLNISDTSQDALLNILIRKAVTTIGNYLNDSSFYTADYIQFYFVDAITEIVTNLYNMKNKNGIKETQQGSRTTIYLDNAGNMISENVKKLLPVPRVRMM